MAIIDTAKIIAELARTGMTVELQENIMKLREEVMALKEENVRLRDDNLQLKQQLDSYSEVDLCPKCKKATWHLEESKPHPIMKDLGVILRTYKCSDCGFNEDYNISPKK